ncbi:hypothetical protein FHG87_026056 [Trinorchestia longiramus]|nr:hypothetical protein FHG87_026056 [Trinorchestia longiramus]
MCSELHGCTTSEPHDEASCHRPMSKRDRRSERDSQPPYIMRLQRSASQTLYPALPKSTSLSRILITCKNQHTANSRAKETETSHPVCGQDGGSNDLRINKNYALELYTSQQDVRTPVLDDGTCTTKK